jgi:hypothetical protein
MRKETKAGSVEWWLTNDVPHAVPISEIGEDKGQDGLTSQQRDRQCRHVRPGRRYIPDLTYDERVPHDDEDDPTDYFDAWEFEPPQFRDWGSPDDTPASWEMDLNSPCESDGCGRPKAPNRRRCFACIKRAQRSRDAILSQSRAKSDTGR